MGWHFTGIICLAEGAVFDASQYAFFGKEVELGGLEDDDRLPTLDSNEEEFFFNREDVSYPIFNILRSYDYFCL